MLSSRTRPDLSYFLKSMCEIALSDRAGPPGEYSQTVLFFLS
nr:MAG TPA: hypothetical protein [Caudoviricetes sp.]